MARQKTMQEKKYTIEAWECAFNALENHIKYIEKDYEDGIWIDTTREFTEEEKTELECYKDVMQIILGLA